MSLVPPLNIIESSDDPAEDTAECPVCGSRCEHPTELESPWDWREEWWCVSCDYAYPD